MAGSRQGGSLLAGLVAVRAQSPKSLHPASIVGERTIAARPPCRSERRHRLGAIVRDGSRPGRPGAPAAGHEEATLNPTHPFVAAVVQLSSTSDEEANWQRAHELVERAARHGARLVATPENTNFLGPHEEKVRRAESLEGETCRRFSELARRLGIHLLLGSFNEACGEARRCHNTSVLFAPDGARLAVYRKIHLFDVDVSEQVRFQESATVKPGEETVVVPTPLGTLGLSICYDLRFPELYRRLTEAGAEILTVPAAFTLTTGRDHWHPLLRARAIENQAYVLAPAQHGRHDDAGLRESFGHAMIVDPWGHVVAMASDGPGLALAEIDPARVAAARRAMPVARHRRL